MRYRGGKGNVLYEVVDLLVAASWEEGVVLERTGEEGSIARGGDGSSGDGGGGGGGWAGRSS